MAPKRRSPKLRRLSIVLVALAITAMVAASASLGDAGGKKATFKTLVIGENTIKSGPNAGSQLISFGFEGYLNWINNHGGVNGYNFEWDSRDNAYNASQSALVQTQLLSTNPFAISVIGTLPVTSAAAVSQNQGSKIPLFVAANGFLVDQLAPSLPSGIFGIVPNYNFLGAYDANFIMTRLNDKKFALAYEDNALAQDASKAIAAYVSKKGGSLSATVPLAATTTDFVPIATQLKASGAKTVLVWTNIGPLSGLQKAAAQIGYSPKWVTPFFGFSSAYLRLAGSLAEGTYVDAILPSRGKAIATFVNGMKDYKHPEAINGAGAQGWQLAAVMVEGIRRASAKGAALTDQSFLKALKAINGPVELAHIDYRKKNWGVTTAAFYQVKNMRFVQLTKFTRMPGS
jgi:ABC-type branched-subunit amino acid transport system substrate-binding protein